MISPQIEHSLNAAFSISFIGSRDNNNNYNEVRINFNQNVFNESDVQRAYIGLLGLRETLSNTIRIEANDQNKTASVVFYDKKEKPIVKISDLAFGDDLLQIFRHTTPIKPVIFTIGKDENGVLMTVNYETAGINWNQFSFDVALFHL